MGLWAGRRGGSWELGGEGRSLEGEGRRGGARRGFAMRRCGARRNNRLREAASRGRATPRPYVLRAGWGRQRPGEGMRERKGGERGQGEGEALWGSALGKGRSVRGREGEGARWRRRIPRRPRRTPTGSEAREGGRRRPGRGWLARTGWDGNARARVRGEKACARTRETEREDRPGRVCARSSRARRVPRAPRRSLRAACAIRKGPGSGEEGEGGEGGGFVARRWPRRARSRALVTGGSGGWELGIARRRGARAAGTHARARARPVTS